MRPDKFSTCKAVMAFALSISLLFGFCFVKEPKKTRTVYNSDDILAVPAVSDEAAVLPADEIIVSSRIFDLLFGNHKNEDENEKTDVKKLTVGGGLFGIQIATDGVTVTEVRDNPLLRVGDVILSIDGTATDTAKTVRELLHASDGTPMQLEILRDGEQTKITVTPKATDGEYRLGILLRDTAAGIGTVSYYDAETGRFGGLGHGICDADSGELVRMKSGIVTDVVLGGVERGTTGKPGELRGVLSSDELGVLEKNTECGVFGIFDFGHLPDSLKNGEVLEVAPLADVHTGTAFIRSTVRGGETRDYEIEITAIGAEDTTKTFSIKVTDPMLIAMTGGIVRGMSGSPILQDGRIVGAVTHVLVGEPTEGYGIYIGNMLDAA